MYEIFKALYLPPTNKHAKLDKFIKPSEFDEYKKMAYAKGFLMVSSSPLTRSSYHASDDFQIMQKNRKLKLKKINEKIKKKHNN